MTRRIRVSEFVKRYAILFVLIALIVLFSIMAPGFRTISNALNIARQVSTTGIAAVGMMFVLLLGGIDLSIGSQVAFVNILCAHLMANMGVNPIIAVLICFACSNSIGVYNRRAGYSI